MFKAFKSLDTLLLAADLKSVELSHFYVYKAVACRDADRYELMYESLQKNKDKIKDEVTWHELSLEGALKLGKADEAKDYLAFLIKKFPESVEYIQKYKSTHNVSSDKELYTTVSK